MCGIFGVNSICDNVLPQLLRGAHRLEHRGYDSMGVAYWGSSGIQKAKISEEEKPGFTVDDLAGKIDDSNTICNIGIVHTRWATYGSKSTINAHPHEFGGIYLVQNGNVENFDKLKKKLVGHEFYSETDTELIVHLVYESYQKYSDMVKAIKEVMSMLEGANAILLMCASIPNRLFAANKGGSICLGKTKESVIVSSDPSGFGDFEILNKISLESNEIAVIAQSDWEIIRKEVQAVSFSVPEDSGKNGYDFFMIKEIFEQPRIIRNTMAGRMIFDRGNAKLGGIEEISRELRKAKTFHFVGCGTAYNACCFARMLFNRFGIAAQSWIASEFCSAHPVFHPNDVFIFVSQSGETADTIEVIEEIKIKGNICLGIVNVPDSRIARITDSGVYIRAGREKGVASTKAFIAQLITVTLLAVFLARQRNMTIDTGQRIITELEKIPDKIETILKQSDEIRFLTSEFVGFNNYYFLGRSFSSITAMEGSLKLKEISYVHAEAYPLGEMKHGPLALISPEFCSIVVIPGDSVFSKGLVNIREIKGRDGCVLAISNEGVEMDMVDRKIIIPRTFEYLSPILFTVPLQLFAYFMTLELGFNPDKPRNLAKTVTVN